MKLPLWTIGLVAVGTLLGLTGCASPVVVEEGMGEGRAEVRYEPWQVRQVFLKAYQQGDKSLAQTVASNCAVRKVAWVGDPKAFLVDNAIRTTDQEGFEIELIILSDGHVGASIADVVMRY